MKITIVGAGMAGLVAANMLRRNEVTVLEKNKTLPYNHTALLRFRTTAVSDATGIPFKKERVLKGLWDGERVVNTPTLAHLNRYSAMVTGGELHNRSIFNLEPAVRWVAPVNFIELMAKSLELQFDTNMDSTAWALLMQHPHPIISTVPMPFMMDAFGWKDKPEFKWLPVWTLKVHFYEPKSSVCQTLYNTEPEEWYRATIHGQELTLEFMHDDTIEHMPYIMANHTLIQTAIGRFFDENFWFGDNPRASFNMDSIRINKIAIGKILPIEEKVRKRFMLWLTEKYNIYSLGRFATWRNILLDDVVQDVKRIEQMIESGTTYEQRLKEQTV